jgi:glycosyltransferase involved in cell wall biosynthesis/GT2 family glycosyltransferase
MIKTVVAVPIFGLTKELPSLVNRLIDSVPQDVDLFLIDDQSNDMELNDFLDKIQLKGIKNLKIVKHERNLGFLETCNRVISENLDADVVFVNSDVIVSNTWFKRLQAAAHSDNTISTVSTWTNNGSILSVDVNFSKLESIESQLDEINEKITKVNRIYPTIPVAVGHLIYIRRAAINVIGVFDTTFGHGYGEEVDYSLRTTEKGFRNVLADDIFVYHSGGTSFDKHPEKSNRKRNESIILEKYEYFQTLLNEFEPKIKFLRENLLKQILGRTLAIDGSCFSYPHSGTSAITFEIIKQMSTQSIFKLSLILERGISNTKLEELLQSTNCSIRFFGEEELQKYDFFWRPYQIWEQEKLEWILKSSEHFILGIQDLIAYDNPSYHGSAIDWANYRNVLTLAAQKASACTYISEYSKNRSIESGIANSNFNIVIPNGISKPRANHDLFLVNSEQVKSRLKVLLVGLDYPHKNYEYSLKLFQKLVAYGYEAELHHIGAPIKVDQYQILESLEFVEHGEVSDDEKYRIYASIDLVFYLSIVEGFGLIPFELSLMNIPVLSSRQGGLDEYLPGVGFYSDEWNLEEDLRRIVQLLENPEIAKECSLELRNISKNYSWEVNVASHINLFMEIDVLHRYRREITQVLPDDLILSGDTIKIVNFLKVVNHLLPLNSIRRKVVKKLLGMSQRH